MEFTIRDISQKFVKIQNAEEIVRGNIPEGSFEGQEPLYDVLDILDDYRAMLYELKVHI